MRLAGDELVAHQAHRHVHALADQRFATLADGAGQRVAQAGLRMRGDDLARHHQTPGGGVDEQRSALAQVRAPVGVADLVADQRVARRLVGDAQQRLGQAHQRHAFLRGQRELLDQPLHEPLAPDAALALTQRRGQLDGQALRGRGLRRRQPRRVEQRRHTLRLGGAVGGGDACAMRRRGGHRTGKVCKGAESAACIGAGRCGWASFGRFGEGIRHVVLP